MVSPPTPNPKTGVQKQVWITDIAAVTSLGSNFEELWQGLLSARTGIKPFSRFSTDSYGSDVAACITGLSPHDGQSMIHGLLDLLFTERVSVPSDALLITATTKAGIDNLERLRRGTGGDPQDILPFGIRDNVSRRLGLKGKGFNISAACASSTIAVAQAAALISQGREKVVVVCCLDLITEFVFSGFSSLKILSPHPCRPFDRERNGLSLGEGAVLLVLMDKDEACRNRRAHLGTVLGWGIANDAGHIISPARDGRGLEQAIRQAIEKAGLQEDQISAINAHGTGTTYNDLMELRAFRKVFGKKNIPVYSVKGSIGHTMGAAGGIEVALGIKTLLEQTAPPTVGFVRPEKGAEGLVSPYPVAISGDYLLTTNSGFGGINAAIILEKGGGM